ncbi:unnamed protein product [Moneuplotes crassus]|uniref:Uncharacterized protein n=1 Tax=Euplotes crassus TaxID=5936 RepID=A0AAD2D4Z8_EUPCR|nr:unnamed protein product [Moneuplotes crassus]
MMTQVDHKENVKPSAPLKEDFATPISKPAPKKKAVRKSKVFDISKSYMEDYEYVDAFLLEGNVIWSLKKRDYSGKNRFLHYSQVPDCDMYHINLKNTE